MATKNLFNVQVIRSGEPQRSECRIFKSWVNAKRWADKQFKKDSRALVTILAFLKAPINEKEDNGYDGL